MPRRDAGYGSVTRVYIDGRPHRVVRTEPGREWTRLFTAQVGEENMSAQHTVPTKWWKSPPGGAIRTGGCVYEKSAVRDDGSGHF